MTSRPPQGPGELYVWVWLPGATEPVVAGRLAQQGGNYRFNYGQSFLQRQQKQSNPFSLYEPELPLKRGLLQPLRGLDMAGCLRDGSPDAWGRRVIIHRLVNKADRRNTELDELVYMLESGSDRIGALDFQASPTQYQPRQAENAALHELLEASDRVDRGEPLPPELARAIQHGSSIGGARPKALIEDRGIKYVAKFSSSSDTYNVVKGEFIAMRLASLAGLHVAQVRMAHSMGKDVLLVERFDRSLAPDGGWTRRLMVSALTMLGLNEMMARYASYEDLAAVVRKRFINPSDTNRELFSRLIFNVLTGNTDDHARNHAAFWDGKRLTLSPAYDICPQGRTGNVASQGMIIAGRENASTLLACVRAAGSFGVSEAEALEEMDRQEAVIREHWTAVCDEAGLSKTDRAFFWNRQFLNPSIKE
ncbi:type II toxin-antitoxin system HipA family toxin [Hydrocarboniclastica marina]|uniref:Type II toxin-antitoxin system HipA family toxin n=1 Tax=Hydrocarboniclastica marina TaxID=2259620 RepID=A0A4P7XKD8_9ALTE|nr:HipA domain-containing protein [Hydrocarboniclastica marina]QCF27508.1 type II toxin-antitoxin system HipA family toxin [Hydrocarboniclastica marina]